MEILGIDVPLYILIGIATLVLLYIYATWQHDFFKKQGIPFPKPYPLIGNSIGFRLMEMFHEWKIKYGNVFGCFLGQEPVYVISDVNILKEIMIKSFNNFRNRRKFRMLPYPFSLGVFFLEDAAWKRVRNIITPTFSSGKLRSMCAAINDCSTSLIANLKATCKSPSSVDMKEYFGAFTMDVIASTAFGIKVDSQNNFDDPFVTNAKQIFTPTNRRLPFLIIITLFPSTARFIKPLAQFLAPKSTIPFFVKTIRDMIDQRRNEPQEIREKRTDFLQLIMDAEVQEGPDSEMTTGQEPQKHAVKRLSTDEVIGQGIIFFVAGYETTASTLNFLSHSIATHPDVQEKMYQEVMEVIGDDEPNYENIGKLKYMENVILETLRMYPPVSFLNRRAEETITLSGVTIPAESSVFIPVYSIHRDPELFPDPDEFKPERHDGKYNPVSFLSFGIGPRICIGMRLALVELKIALVHVVKAVKFEVAEDTPIPLKLTGFGTLQTVEPNKLKVSLR